MPVAGVNNSRRRCPVVVVVSSAGAPLSSAFPSSPPVRRDRGPNDLYRVTKLLREQNSRSLCFDLPPGQTGNSGAETASAPLRHPHAAQPGLFSSSVPDREEMVSWSHLVNPEPEQVERIPDDRFILKRWQAPSTNSAFRKIRYFRHCSNMRVSLWRGGVFRQKTTFPSTLRLSGLRIIADHKQSSPSCASQRTCLTEALLQTLRPW